MSRDTLFSYPLDEKRYISVLTIAGTDSSGGAGVQADIKTFAALRCFGMSVVTALTAQNTRGVQGIHSPPSTFVRLQLESVFSDIHKIDAIKIGMLECDTIVDEVARYLQEHKNSLPPIVLDPVVYAKSGDQLVEQTSVDMLREKLLPLATVLTSSPQVASLLLKRNGKFSIDDVATAARDLLAFGCKAVLMKSFTGRECLVVPDEKAPIWIGEESEWMFEIKNLHGLGSTYSAAIAAFLGRGDPLLTAVRKAKIFVMGALIEGEKYKLGHGIGPVCHTWMTADVHFVQAAWYAIADIYVQIKQLPFIQELAYGTLAWNKFEHYIEQDILFLFDRFDVCGMLATRVSFNKELKNILVKLAEDTKLYTESILNKYGVNPKQPHLLKKSLVCTAYTNFMKNVTTEPNPLVFGIVAMVPRELIYQKVGEHFKTLQKPPNQCYESWLETYSNADRRQAIEKLLAMVDLLVLSVCPRSDDDQLTELINTFKLAAQLEHDFWVDAYSVV